jgi:lysophospholipase L1-like esterase
MKKLIFLGDSTLQYNDETTYPQVGWPQAMYKDIKEDVKICNLAVNGRSTKSFIEMGNFEKALEEVDDQSIVIIEFGHNDEHDYDPERYTRPDHEYRDNLLYMISECKKKGAYVLLITPIYRRWFNEDGTIKDGCHEGYREAMLKVAKDSNTDVIDMTMLTKKMISELGDEGSRELFMNFPKGLYPDHPEGSNDNTHLRMAGAKAIADIFRKEVINNKYFEELFND